MNKTQLIVAWVIKRRVALGGMSSFRLAIAREKE